MVLDTCLKCRRGGGSLVDIARAKRLEPRYLEIVAKNKSDLTDAELLGCVVYTGTAAQGNIRLWLRSKRNESDPKKWWVTANAIRRAVAKLKEDPPEWLYHGLNGVHVEVSPVTGHAEIFQYGNFISASMSNDVSTDFAKGEGGTVDSPSQSGTVLHIHAPSFCKQHLHGESDYGRNWVMADMRWISKFPSEEEWLLAPLSIGRHSMSSLRTLSSGEAASLPADLNLPGIYRWVMYQQFVNQ
mmetsp:Transcript_87236/g.152249  ORF Transcript_87236/g.152249 Transcript_87236/m.152249 type:complete len:242 (+) Transcript_87236:170-895(+)